MSLPKEIRLYNAGVKAGLIDPTERTAEEWWARVGDFGLDDARQALDTFIETELTRLRTLVVNAARRYRKEDNYRNTFALDAALEALEKFEDDYALDVMGRQRD